MSFAVESDARLAFDVGGPANELPLRGVAGMGSQVAPYLLPPHPWEFLLAAGRATAAIFSPARVLFDVSSHWAIARWFWALDWSSTNVRLGPKADEIRNHHRIAFSEAMGLAAGLLLVEHIAGDALPHGLSRGGPMIVDVDSYVSNGERPDLLILFGKPNLDTYVLEAKGNSSGRAYSLNQLKRGIKQVLAAPGKAQRLVVSAAASGTELNVHAVSVVGGRTEVEEDLPVVSPREALAMELSRLASFAGAPPLSDEEGTTFPIPELDVDLVGRQLTLPIENFTAVVTMGVNREVLGLLPEVASLGDLAEMRSDVSGNRRLSTGDPGESAPLTEVGRAATMGSDGCALVVELR
jgi:hypothetical protein